MTAKWPLKGSWKLSSDTGRSLTLPWTDGFVFKETNLPKCEAEIQGTGYRLQGCLLMRVRERTATRMIRKLEVSFPHQYPTAIAE